ncbi:MAG: hypothetical protein AAGE96_26000 [Cyanobacteria bacterium P01_G01_bin.19]
MTKINNSWGGKRPNSGRKSKREGYQKMETFLSPEIKQQAAAKAKQMNLSQSDYLKRLIEIDLLR